MNSLSTYLLIIIILLLGFAGYYYLDKIVPMQEELRELRQNDEVQKLQIENLEEKKAALATQLETKIKEVSKEKEKEISQLKSTYEELISGLENEIEKGEITITRLADQLNVKIVDRIIFPSGQAEITPEGVKVLQRVGKILKQVQDKHIKVEGHTDNVPIHPNIQEQFPTNWELSVIRATNVVRFLIQDVGIDATNLEAAGFAEFKPVASNQTKRGRARNRRIEILLLPNTHKQMDVANQENNSSKE